MRCNEVTYHLSINGGASSQVFPFWDSSNNIEQVKEDSRWFARTRLTGEFVFKKGDYDLIFAQDLDAQMIMTVQIEGVDQRVTASFYRLDVTFNEDEKEASVSPTSGDEYDILLTSMDREFNLPDLAPTTQMNYKFRSVLQVYVLGRPVISNYLGGNYWETQITAEFNRDEVRDTYKFGRIGWQFIAAGTGHDFEGLEFIDTNDAAVAFIDRTGQYLISPNSGINPITGVSGNFWAIRDLTTGGTFGSLVYIATEPRASSTDFPVNEFNPIGDVGFTFQKISDPSVEVHFFGGEFYARILNNYTGGVFVVETLPEDDIANTNYRSSLPLDDLHIILSNGSQTEVTRFGQLADDALFNPNNFFTQPDLDVFPINRSEWTNVSTWVEKTFELDNLEIALSADFVTNDAFAMFDVINAMLQEIDPRISHDRTDSVYLYTDRIPVFVPLSNIIFGDYDEPAKRQNIKFSDIDNALRIKNCGWHIENGRFKIEHVSFYRNGRSYGDPVFASDLTTRIEPKTELNWDHFSTIYSFETQELWKDLRIKFRQRLSDAFEGHQIICQAGYTDNLQSLELQAGQLLTDIDFILSQSVSNLQGLFWGEMEEVNGLQVLPINRIIASPTESYTLQNGFLSTTYIVYNDWLDNVPCDNLEIGTETITANSVIRFRTQRLELGEIENFDIMGLVKTRIGDGLVMTRTLNLETNTLILKINYDAR